MKIEKEQSEVVIFTVHHRLEATMYTYKDARILDELNAGAKNFIALTNVKVFSPTGVTPLYEGDFMAINKDHILQVMPKVTPKKEKDYKIFKRDSFKKESFFE